MSFEFGRVSAYTSSLSEQNCELLNAMKKLYIPNIKLYEEVRVILRQREDM